MLAIPFDQFKCMRQHNNAYCGSDGCEFRFSCLTCVLPDVSKNYNIIELWAKNTALKKYGTGGATLVKGIIISTPMANICDYGGSWDYYVTADVAKVLKHKTVILKDENLTRDWRSYDELIEVNRLENTEFEKQKQAVITAYLRDCLK